MLVVMPELVATAAPHVRLDTVRLLEVIVVILGLAELITQGEVIPVLAEAGIAVPLVVEDIEEEKNRSPMVC